MVIIVHFSSIPSFNWNKKQSKQFSLCCLQVQLKTGTITAFVRCPHLSNLWKNWSQIEHTPARARTHTQKRRTECQTGDRQEVDAPHPSRGGGGSGSNIPAVVSQTHRNQRGAGGRVQSARDGGQTNEQTCVCQLGGEEPASQPAVACTRTSWQPEAPSAAVTTSRRIKVRRAATDPDLIQSGGVRSRDEAGRCRGAGNLTGKPLETFVALLRLQRNVAEMRRNLIGLRGATEKNV